MANSGGSIDTDGFTQVFSHELAESMAAAVHVNDPGGLGLGYQIADGEPEYFGNGYTYRLANGSLVQAYWSQRDGGWVVPDGNSQRFTLSWASSTFNNTFNLQVNGDQLGVNYNDDITVDRSPNTSGTRVTMDGQSASFALGAIKSLNINTGGGYNTVHLKGVESGETVNVDSFSTNSFDDVIVGSNGSLAGIQGTVNVSNSSGRSWLQIDDSNDEARNITITDHSVTFQGLTTINYTPFAGPSGGFVHGVMGLEIDDTWGANEIDAERARVHAGVDRGQPPGQPVRASGRGGRPQPGGLLASLIFRTPLAHVHGGEGSIGLRPRISLNLPHLIRDANHVADELASRIFRGPWMSQRVGKRSGPEPPSHSPLDAGRRGRGPCRLPSRGRDGRQLRRTVEQQRPHPAQPRATDRGRRRLRSRPGSPA